MNLIVFSQSPMSERDQTSSAVNIIVNSPPKSVYSILKPQTSYSNNMPSQECMLIYSYDVTFNFLKAKFFKPHTLAYNIHVQTVYLDILILLESRFDYNILSQIILLRIVH